MKKLSDGRIIGLALYCSGIYVERHSVFGNTSTVTQGGAR